MDLLHIDFRRRFEIFPNIAVAMKKNRREKRAPKPRIHVGKNPTRKAPTAPPNVNCRATKAVMTTTPIIPTRIHSAPSRAKNHRSKSDVSDEVG